MNGAGGAPRTADRAWLLARELATLMDEAERAEIDLAARLPDAADPAYAAHWARTLEFLQIVTACLAGLAGGKRRDEPGGAPGRVAERAGERVGRRARRTSRC